MNDKNYASGSWCYVGTYDNRPIVHDITIQLLIETFQFVKESNENKFLIIWYMKLFTR